MATTDCVCVWFKFFFLMHVFETLPMNKVRELWTILGAGASHLAIPLGLAVPRELLLL